MNAVRGWIIAIFVVVTIGVLALMGVIGGNTENQDNNNSARATITQNIV